MTFVRRSGPREASGEGTLLELARRAGLPLASSCRGAGVCDACLVEVVHGEENLTPRTQAEQAARLPPARRLACQARAVGPVTLTTAYW